MKTIRRDPVPSSSALLLTALLLPACISTTSEPLTQPALSPPQLVRHSLMSPATGLERDYFVYLPRGYAEASDRRWPTIVFLHGHGERGDAKEELGWVMSHGPLYEAWILKRDLPFILVLPQLPMFDMKTSALPRGLSPPNRRARASCSTAGQSSRSRSPASRAS